jgi:site-specific DNA recombinase
VDETHEPLVSVEQFEAVQRLREQRREQYGNTAFQSKHLLTGLLFCGHCEARYYLRSTGKYAYYAYYSRTKQIKNMIKTRIA